MKKRLCIGLINPSEVLISILNSIGVWYEIADLNEEFSNYVLLIIDGNSPLENTQIKMVREFQLQEGLVLEISSSPTFFLGGTTSSFKRTIFNVETNSVFDRISYLDIFSVCSFSASSNILSGLVDYQKSDKNNNVGFIGLDLRNIPTRKDYARKRFLSHLAVPADELVSKVSFDALNDVIELSIKKLLNDQGLPFIKKWASPNLNPIFGFRIDSDYGIKDSLENIYSLLSKHSIKATWFLHVSAHEGWLEYFNTFDHQEIALHGYQHGYSHSEEKITSNIEKGLSLLIKNKIDPSGFCAPYGIWNTSLENSLKKFEFKYTSEFTTGYDSNPFYIKDTSYLQIPIHPICTGSLSRKRYLLEDIQQYFINIYENKKRLFKPILFYHHPLQIGLNIFDEVFKKVNTDGLTNLTFKEYAEFWEKRTKSQFSAFYNDGKIEIKSQDQILYLYISNSQKAFDLIQSKDQVLDNDLKGTFKYQTPSLPSLGKLENLHLNRIGLMKTSFIDWKNRHRL